MPKIKFTEEQIEAMRELRDRYHLSWDEIGRRFGVSHSTAQSAVNPEFAKRRQAYEQARNRKSWREAEITISAVSVPDYVAKKREELLNAPYRSPASVLLGEPPIGFSALDRKLAGVGA